MKQHIFDTASFDFDFDLSIDDGMFDLSIDDDKMTTRFIKPKKTKEIPARLIKYRNAEKLASDIGCSDGMQVICLVDGSFIAGDFIEAFVKTYNLHVKKLSISTLSLNENNVDSLGNLLFDEWADQIDLIVSDGFYANYRNDIIKYMYKELGFDDRFQLAVARVHTKIILIETHCGKKILIKGSANLRSSQSIEHMEIEENKEVFDFFMGFHDHIVETYKTINKGVDSIHRKRSLKRTESWQAEI